MCCVFFYDSTITTTSTTTPDKRQPENDTLEKPHPPHHARTEPQLMDTPFSGTVIEEPREQVVKSGTTITFSCRAAFASPALTAERSLSSLSSSKLPIASSSLLTRSTATETHKLKASSKFKPSPLDDNKTNNHSTKHAIWSVNGHPIRAKVNIHIKRLVEVGAWAGGL